MLVSGRCEECGVTYTRRLKSPSPKPRRFCSKRCIARAGRRRAKDLPMLVPVPCAFPGCTGMVSVKRQRYLALYCASGQHRASSGEPRPLASLVVMQRPKDVVDGYELDLMHSCGEMVVPQTENGALVDWCPRCRVTIPVPTRGVRTYDQRADLEAELTRGVTRATAKALPVKHTSAGMKRIVVGVRDQGQAA